jgi:TRAP-type mannitol/chloroaromatic compound transport system substrate-binding protein
VKKLDQINGYWAGKNMAFNIIGSHPMGLTATDFMTWVYQAGGFDLMAMSKYLS